jgi:hypothetical protein
MTKEYTMANTFAQALGTGLTAGAERYAQEQKEAPFREERLKQARMETELAQQRLDSAPTRQSTEQMQNQMMQIQLRQAQGAQIKSQSYDAFRLYEADGDARHLNTFYTAAKQTPMGANMFGQLARVDSLTRTPETEKMLRASGVEDLDGFFSDPELVKGFVVSTQTNGEKVLTDMNQVYVGTGFTNYMTNERLDTMTKQAMLARQMQTGQSYQNITSRERIAREMSDALGIPVYEAYMQLDKKSDSTSNLQRLASQIQSEFPELSDFEAMDKALKMLKSTETERYAAGIADKTGGDATDVQTDIRERKARTTAQKNIEATAGVREQIQGMRDEGYDSTDPEQRRKMGRLVTDLEAITGSKMSTEDRRVARELRNLTQLGGTAGAEITDKETGPLDYMLKNFKMYVSDEVGGTTATTSYEQFRNVFRNALYGATLTDAEIQAFTRAAGSLSQQRGPVLVALRTQMQSVKNNIQSIYDKNDPDIADHYLGMSLEDADGVIEALDQRIDLMAGGTRRESITADGDSAGRASLDQIFGG